MSSHMHPLPHTLCADASHLNVCCVPPPRVSDVDKQAARAGQDSAPGVVNHAHPTEGGMSHLVSQEVSGY